MKYGSVCSGVEAATLAWSSLGWECKFVSEVEPFPCAVLQERLGATAPIHPLDPAEATDEKTAKCVKHGKSKTQNSKQKELFPMREILPKSEKSMQEKSTCLSAEHPALQQGQWY